MSWATPGAKSGCFFIQAYGLESFLGISNNREKVNLESIFMKNFIPIGNLDCFIYFSLYITLKYAFILFYFVKVDQSAVCFDGKGHIGNLCMCGT